MPIHAPCLREADNTMLVKTHYIMRDNEDTGCRIQQRWGKLTAEYERFGAMHHKVQKIVQCMAQSRS